MPNTSVSFEDAIKMRIYLMATICVVNCLRASNLMKVKLDPEIKMHTNFITQNIKHH